MSDQHFRIRVSRLALRSELQPAAVILPDRLSQPVPDAAQLSDPNAGQMPQAPDRLSPFDIVGFDDRLRIANTAVFPFSAIAHLLVLNVGGQPMAQGTGWFASPTTLITAAHVIAPITGGAPQRVAAIQVIPGRSANSAPFGSQVSSNMAFAPGWAGPNPQENDFGAIRIAQPMGAAGAFAPGAFPDPDVPRLIANLTGYPALPPQGTPQGTQWGATGAVAVKPGSPGMLSYTTDMTAGQSGAPLLVSVQGRIFAIGVNVSGMATFNEAVRITPAVASQIGQWTQASTL